MKLKPKVIHELAQYVFREMSRDEKWSVKAEEGRIEQAIAEEIEKNLKAEEALDREAKGLLEAQLAKVPGATIDTHKALGMIKKQLAKQKGFVL